MNVVKLNDYPSKSTPTPMVEISYFKNVEDHEVWKKFKQGDETAFAFIYTEYAPALFNFGCQLFMDRELIKDCIQDLFIDLKVKHGKLSDVKSIKSYLYKSLYNLVRKKLKKKGKSIETDDHQLDFAIDIPIDDRIIHSETAATRIKWLQESLNKLNKRQRQAILLYYYEGLSYDQIKEIMEIKSVDGTRMLIKRGLDKLKDNANGDELLYSSAITILMILGTL